MCKSWSGKFRSSKINCLSSGRPEANGYFVYSRSSEDFFIAGYINSTSAVNAIQFTMDSGTFDGTIKM